MFRTIAYHTFLTSSAARGRLDSMNAAWAASNSPRNMAIYPERSLWSSKLRILWRDITIPTSPMCRYTLRAREVVHKRYRLILYPHGRVSISTAFRHPGIHWLSLIRVQLNANWYLNMRFINHIIFHCFRATGLFLREIILYRIICYFLRIFTIKIYNNTSWSYVTAFKSLMD